MHRRRLKHLSAPFFSFFLSCLENVTEIQEESAPTYHIQVRVHVPIVAWLHRMYLRSTLVLEGVSPTHTASCLLP